MIYIIYVFKCNSYRRDGIIIELEGGEYLVDLRSLKWFYNLFWKIWKSNWSVFELFLILWIVYLLC